MHSDASQKYESDAGEAQKSGDLNRDDSVHAISDYQRLAQGFLCHALRRAASRSKLRQ